MGLNFFSGITAGSGIAYYPGISAGGGISYGESNIIATNGNTFPVSLSSATTNNVQHTFKTRQVAGPSTLKFRKLYFTYVNYRVGVGFETNGGFDFDIRMGVRDASGNWWPGYCNGARDVTLVAGGTCVFIVDFPCSGGDTVTEVNRVTGPASSVQYLRSHPTVAFRNEAILIGTDTSLDLTLGGSGANQVGFGATAIPTLSAGAVNSIAAGSPGSGYGNASNTLVDIIAKDAAASSSNYAANVTAGAFTSGFKVAGGSGFSTNPDCYVVNCGAGSPNDSIGYAASIVSGEANMPYPSLVLLGSSSGRGFTSTDGFGTFKGNFGIVERPWNGAYGLLNLSVSSMTSSGFVSTKQYNTISLSGVKITHAIIQFGINDITGGAAFSTLANNQAAHASYWRGNSAKVIFTTLQPSTTGTWTGPLSNQTVSTGCDVGGVRDQYNSAVRTKSDSRLAGDLDCLDVSAIAEDPTVTQKWRTDLAFALTGDGQHFSGWSTGTAKTGTTYNFLSATQGLDYFTSTFLPPTIMV